MRIVNSIISGNQAVTDANEIKIRTDLPADKVFLTNNLIGTSGSTTARALVGNYNFTSNILATNDGGRPTALINILLPLADNGGRTLTHALPLNSPAIDAATDGAVVQVFVFTLYLPGCRGEELGPASPLPPYRADQRGIARPFGDACDIGAYESEIDNSQCYVVKAVNDKTIVFCL